MSIENNDEGKPSFKDKSKYFIQMILVPTILLLALVSPVALCVKIFIFSEIWELGNGYTIILLLILALLEAMLIVLYILLENYQIQRDIRFKELELEEKDLDYRHKKE